MERWLLVVVVLYVVWRVLHLQGRRLLRTSRGADDFGRLSRDPRRRRDEEEDGGERLLACARCGATVKESTVEIGAGGERLCSACAGRQNRRG